VKRCDLVRGSKR